MGELKRHGAVRAVPDNVSSHSSSLTCSQVLEDSCLLYEIVSMLLTWDNKLSLNQLMG